MHQPSAPMAAQAAFTRQWAHPQQRIGGRRFDQSLVRVQGHAASGNAAQQHPVRIATRGSPLALAQAEQVAALLHAALMQQHATQQQGTQSPSASLLPAPELVIMSARGDKPGDTATASMRDLGPGAFTEELDAAVASGHVRAAVHSLKDAPAVPPSGLVLAGCLPREDPRDVLLLAPRLADMLATGKLMALQDLPVGCVIGTASTRRKAQLVSSAPGVKVVNLRGSVQARLAALREGKVDATLLALSGLARLGYVHLLADGAPHKVPTHGNTSLPAVSVGPEPSSRVPGVVLPASVMMPAACQGAVGVVVRSDDDELIRTLATVGDLHTLLSVTAERAWLACIMAHTRSLTTTPGSVQPPAEELLQAAKAAFGRPGAVALPDCAVACLGTVEVSTVEAGPQVPVESAAGPDRMLRLQALMLDESGGWEVLLETSCVLEEGATPAELLGTAEQLGAEVAQESLRAYKEIMLL